MPEPDVSRLRVELTDVETVIAGTVRALTKYPDVRSLAGILTSLMKRQRELMRRLGDSHK